MSAMASQITSLTIVYLTVYSGADQRKHQSSASSAQMASNAENVSIWWRLHDHTRKIPKIIEKKICSDDDNILFNWFFFNIELLTILKALTNYNVHSMDYKALPNNDSVFWWPTYTCVLKLIKRNHLCVFLPLLYQTVPYFDYFLLSFEIIISRSQANH